MDFTYNDNTKNNTNTSNTKDNTDKCNTDINLRLKASVSCIRGVGGTRLKLMNNLGIFTIEDVITYFPRDYEDRSSLNKISELEDGKIYTFEGRIMSKVLEKRIRRGFSVYQVIIKDETGTITGTWYNQSYIKNVFIVGETYIFHGKVTRRLRTFETQNPIYEKCGEQMKNTMRIIPLYPSTANLPQNTLRTIIESALNSVKGCLVDVMPEWIIKKYSLKDFNSSIVNIHFPKSLEEYNEARKRLVFEELFLLQVGLLSIKSTLKDDKQGIAFSPLRDEINDFMNSLHFELTNAQKKVLSEIQMDMERPLVMNRLIQGDVGSGKTIVASIALFKAVKSGYQGTLMVPTEILARQHYSSIKTLMEKWGINVEILVGSQTKNQKLKILEKIENGQAQIIIGTHALIEDNVAFMKLGLVITDEQHRFGVRQRAVLSKKGENPDILVMTATPIPRTLALILYGDLDISVIDELPPGRKPIETYAVDESMRERINNFVRKHVTEGRQAYIICPLVKESESVEAKSAIEHAYKIANEDLLDLRVGLIHGKMKGKEKEDVMTRFVNGEIDVLVSTTVIEVGVNVPNATVMIIENAERFGLAQLHQLRGRVGRGDHQSYCILYNDSKSKISKERMKIMGKTNDGFIISEKDLELRGPGEFFGTRQHGIPELKIANLYRDMEILKEAQKAAQEVIKNDSNLTKSENLLIREKLLDNFKDKLENLSLN